MRLTFAAPPEGDHAVTLWSQSRAILEHHSLDARPHFLLMSRSLLWHVDLPLTGTLTDRQRAAASAFKLVVAFSDNGYRLIDTSFELSVLADRIADRPGFSVLAGQVRAALERDPIR